MLAGTCCPSAWCGRCSLYSRQKLSKARCCARRLAAAACIPRRKAPLLWSGLFFVNLVLGTWDNGQTMKHNLSLFLIPSILVCAAAPALVAQGNVEPLSCADRSITASAVRTPEDVQAFVQCAYELVREVGFEEARRAFHEDERWQYGSYYVFVDGIAKSGEGSIPYVYPPAPSREGSALGSLVDNFGNDIVSELDRIMSIVDSGWLYYAFLNPATGNDEPKASYVKRIDWDGNPAVIGAGI